MMNPNNPVNDRISVTMKNGMRGIAMPADSMMAAMTIDTTMAPGNMPGANMNGIHHPGSRIVYFLQVLPSLDVDEPSTW